MKNNSVARRAYVGSKVVQRSVRLRANVVYPVITGLLAGKFATYQLPYASEMAALARRHKLIPFEHVVYKATATGGMLVDLRTSACFGLNRVGAEVWARLAAGDTIPTTIEVIRRLYALQSELAESDVSRICDEFVKAGLGRYCNEERPLS